MMKIGREGVGNSVMIDRYINKIVDNIGQANNFNDIQKEQSSYVLRVILYEIIKIAILICFFSILGYFKEVLTISIFMVFTKPFTGGYHEDSQIKCFFASAIIIGSIILLVYNSSLNLNSKIILSCINIFCIYHRTPVISNKMPIKKESLIKRNRTIGISVNGIFLVLAINLNNNLWFSQTIIWTSIVQTILLFNKRERRSGNYA